MQWTQYQLGFIGVQCLLLSFLPSMSSKLMFNTEQFANKREMLHAEC